MYILLAEMATPEWSGEIGRESCDTLDAAEQKMARWARFGVDAYCNEADQIRILDDRNIEVRRWNWRKNRSDPVAADQRLTG